MQRFAAAVAASLCASALLAAAALGQAVKPFPAQNFQIQYSLSTINGRSANYYTDQFNAMTAQLGLTDDQRGKLRTDIDAMNAALDAAEKDAFGDPVSPNGPGLVRMPQGESLTQLQEKVDRIANENELKIMAELDAGQKLVWAKVTLGPLINSSYATLKLTPEEIEKSNALIDDTAKELAAATDAEKFGDIQGHMIRKWVGEILTDHQATEVVHPNYSATIMGRAINTGAPPPSPPARGGDAGLP